MNDTKIESRRKIIRMVSDVLHEADIAQVVVSSTQQDEYDSEAQKVVDFFPFPRNASDVAKIIAWTFDEFFTGGKTLASEDFTRPPRTEPVVYGTYDPADPVIVRAAQRIFEIMVGNRLWSA